MNKSLKMTRGRILVFLGSTVIVAGFPLIFLTTSPAQTPGQSAHPVLWAPNAVNAIVAPGGRAEVDVSLNVVKKLGNIDIQIGPEIDPYVDVSPSTFNNVKAGGTIQVHLTIQAGTTAPLGLFDGTIQVRQKTTKPDKGKVLARPLPVTVLIREAEGIAGSDADNNGVWDYVDQYINATYPDAASTRVALRQYARALGGALLHADDKSLSLRYASDISRAIECLFFVRTDDAAETAKDFKAVILNTKTRNRANFMFSAQLAGQVFPGTPFSQRGASCVAE